ncbi:hypothetical protein PG985_012626 [Apiospora marii]|uniref:Ankyrin n=1 Tax=Apiospora marii TaxID=335849 RepID=A0ABR1RD25_9PEZI
MRMPWPDKFEQLRVKLFPESNYRDLERGARPTECLMWNAYTGNLAMVTYQIDRGAQVVPLDFRFNGYMNRANALSAAVMGGHEMIVKFLLEYAGAESVKPVAGVESALSLATARGSVSMVGMLLEHGANPDVPDTGRPPPVVMAVLMERTDILNLLRGHGARLDTPETGAWAMAVAKMHGLSSMVEYLVRNKVDEDEVYHDVPNRPSISPRYRLYWPGVQIIDDEDLLAWGAAHDDED